MKQITIILMFLAVQGIAQTKTIEIDKIKAGQITATKYQSINLKSNDTTNYTSVMFRDLKYKYIIEISSFILYGNEQLKEDVQLFLKDATKDINMHLNRDEYSVIISDYNNMITIYANKDNGYTRITSKQAEKLLKWL